MVTDLGLVSPPWTTKPGCPRVAQFNSAGSDGCVRGHCGYSVDERNSDPHGDDQGNDDSDDEDWVTCLEQKDTTLRPNP